jgi:hypothetical protein
MAELDFLFHLPMLRIGRDLIPFGPGRLYRMPFEKYDAITARAFSEQEALYRATEPVFFSLTLPVPDEVLERRIDEVKGILEIKMPSLQTETLDETGLKAFNLVHQEFAVPAWTALLLACPAAALAPPRWSQCFVGVDGGFTLRLSSGPAILARIQGEADHEYLFLPDAPSERFPDESVALAAGLIDSVRAWDRIPALHAALSTLRATGLPALSRQDRLTLSVQALESLLLPEVQSTLKRTFSRRVAALLAEDADARARWETSAATLYSLRSESVHGGALPDDSAALADSLAEEMLGAAIRAMGARVLAGERIESIRADLDLGKVPGGGNPGFGMPSRPIRRASEYRLGRRTPSDVLSITSPMASPKGRSCCWSPLIGLSTADLEDENGMVLGRPPVCVLMPLSPDELIGLEERDVRRDFMRGFVHQGKPMSILMTVPDGPDPGNAFAHAAHMRRMRDLGVVSLRLAGFDRFHDPELFGPTLFEGSRRLRWPMVMRQTIAEKIRHQATQQVTAADYPRLAGLVGELQTYESGGRSPAIEYALGLFRRSFDRDFLAVEQRAVILVGLFESMLGRFRPFGNPVQLEDLLESLLGHDEDVMWFRAEGRRLRNRVAHGELAGNEPPAPFETLSRLCSRVLAELISTWNRTAGEDRVRPSAVLIRKATALFTGSPA